VSPAKKRGATKSPAGGLPVKKRAVEQVLAALLNAKLREIDNDVLAQTASLVPALFARYRPEGEAAQLQDVVCLDDDE